MKGRQNDFFSWQVHIFLSTFKGQGSNDGGLFRPILKVFNNGYQFKLQNLRIQSKKHFQTFLPSRCLVY